VLLNEKLGPLAILGMVLIVGGVWGATLGQDEGGGPFRALPLAVRRRGTFDGLMAGICQGLGATCAKLGMATVAPLPATLVRMTWATIAITLVLVLQRRATGLLGRFRDRRALVPALGAVILGPFLGVWGSLAAFKHADTGVAMALISTVPILVLLPSWVVYRDKPSPTSLVGVVVAVAGGALLFLR
jgi:drug/metabolite transporter (DMT)-like permease